MEEPTAEAGAVLERVVAVTATAVVEVEPTGEPTGEPKEVAEEVVAVTGTAEAVSTEEWMVERTEEQTAEERTVGWSGRRA